MKKKLSTPGGKAALAIFCVLALFLSGVCAAVCGYQAGYGRFGGGEELFDYLSLRQMNPEIEEVLCEYVDTGKVSDPGGNFIWKITDADSGETLASSFTGTESVRDVSVQSEASSGAADSDSPYTGDQVITSGTLCLEDYGTYEYYIYNAYQEKFVYADDLDDSEIAITEPYSTAIKYSGFTYDGWHYEYDEDEDVFYRATEIPTEGSDTEDSYHYIACGYLRCGLPESDSYAELYNFCVAFSALRWVFLGGFLLFGIIGLVLLVLLCCHAGYTAEGEKHVALIHRIPADLALVILMILGSICLAVGAEFLYMLFPDRMYALGITAFSVCVLALVILFVYFVVSLTVRVRCHTLRENTLIYRLTRNGRKLGGRLLYLLERLPLVWRPILVYGLISFFELVLLAGAHTDGEIVTLFVMLKFCGIFVVMSLALGYREIHNGAKRIESGDYATEIDTKKLFRFYRGTADSMNNIQSGMTAAVESRLQSERMKTELITNVTHDLKTPLTAIVSYVDLLKKEPAGSEKAEEYIDVLDRQSTRMKKLVEDLVELSKANSGTIQVEAAPLDPGMLLSQVMGEYSERLTAAGITPVLQIPEAETAISADGKLLWRVFDNLLGNCLKYALPGTRCYVSLETDERTAVVCIRNITREQITVSPEELTERFVRGDASRHTEGSGLGLAIAKSLTEAMGGTFALTIDGDLFRVSVSFPVM